jgi:alkylation response protein AidB-like acyl-CoA dehydrogenase
MARGSGIGGGFSDEQRRRILPLAARGQVLGGFALSEPEAGSDAANLSCRAEQTGDGWLITGAKMWCTFADGGHYIVPFARTSPPPGALLGEEGRGFRIAMAGLEVGRAHTAAHAIGLARGALEDSVAYAQSRVQFGQPIGNFQAIRSGSPSWPRTSRRHAHCSTASAQRSTADRAVMLPRLWRSCSRARWPSA